MAEMITLSNGIEAYLATPEGEAKGALIVIHEIWGLVPQTKDVADRFAAEGYLVLAPSLLAETGIAPERVAEFERLLFDPEAQPADRVPGVARPDPFAGTRCQNLGAGQVLLRLLG